MKATIYSISGVLRHYALFLLSLSALFLLSCQEEKMPEPENEKTEPVTGVFIRDIANNGNASDLRFSFSQASMSDVQAYRLYVVKSTSSNAIDVGTVESSSFFLALNADENTGRLPADFKDLDGDPIAEKVKYNVFILSIAPPNTNEDNVLSAPSNKLSLEQITVVRTLARINGAGTGGLEVDQNGDIYMGDFGKDTNGGGDKVLKITPDGTVTTFATGFRTASGNDFDREGNLFQSSFHGQYISKITPDGQVSTLVSGGLLEGPVGIAIDRANNLFVADWKSSAILKITPTGEVSLFSNSSFLNGPNGLDFDAQGNLYVSNWNNTNIVKISPDGDAQVFANTPTGNAHMLIHQGIIYAVGRPGHRISMIHLATKNVSDLINNGRGIADGDLTMAQISYPNDIAFSPDGSKMYINHVEPGPPNGFTISPTIIKVVEFAK